MRFITKLVFVLPMLCNVCEAATIVQTETFSGTPAFSRSLTFNEFDPSLGTLNAVFVELELSSENGELRLDNDDETTSAITIQYGAEADITSTDVSLLNSLFQPVVSEVHVVGASSLTLAADDGDGATFSTVGADAGVLAPSAGTDSDLGSINPLFFPQFTGSGTYDIGVETGQMIDFGGVGGVQFQGDPITADGFVTVTYVYNPVPSPSSFAGALSMAIVGIPLWLRRRTR